MKIGIYGKNLNEKCRNNAVKLIEKLEKHKFGLFVYEPFYNLLLKKNKIKFSSKIIPFNSHLEIKNKIDFLFGIGGDGTILNTINLVYNSGIPIMGINTGRLGFLSSTSVEDCDKAIQCLIDKDYYLDKRTLLKLETENNLFRNENYALNDVTIQKKDISSMVNIHAYINGEFLNSYWADGLLVSTPTGSTAYSLSCGGPIVVPESKNFVINPIAPHNLNVRPIIIPDDKTITLKIEGKSKSFLICLDSRVETIDSKIELKITKANFCINLVRLKNQNFFSTIRNKLMWGMDKRN
ncbi:MAG: NAD kinase [Bacteroidales bacterium]|jgi:NAD+ kinase